MFSLRTQQFLGPEHGYRFEGDEVSLNAQLNFDAEAAQSPSQWSLQLWANPQGFGNELQGIKVAELAIAPVSGAVFGTCSAMPPAGDALQYLTLAVVEHLPSGASATRDADLYPAPAKFSQPMLQGTAACDWQENGVALTIPGIVHPRAPEVCSGTLSLELWATDTPYQGGAWSGRCLAATELAPLPGNEAYRDYTCQFPLTSPLAASHLVLMLREWTAQGYVTRDYQALALPAQPEATVATDAEKATATDTVETTATATAKADVTADAAESAQVSINQASASQLAALKGMPAKVAKAIVAGRPYASLDELLRIKGMGEKLLAKLRDRLGC